MPNRYIRESAIESQPVNALSWQGEVFYRRLLNRADDFGRFTANLALLRASLFPLQLDKVSEKDVARLLKEAEDCGLLATYGVDGKQFVTIAKWEKGRAQQSKYPPPPENICERLQTYVYSGKHTHTDVHDSDSDSDSDSPKAPKGAEPVGFADFWGVYPRKESKVKAINAWKKNEPDQATQSRILKDVVARKASEAWTKENGQYIPHPASYLNQRRWEDLIEVPQTKEMLADKLRAHPGNPNHVAHSTATSQQLCEFSEMLTKYKAMP